MQELLAGLRLLLSAARDVFSFCSISALQHAMELVLLSVIFQAVLRSS